MSNLTELIRQVSALNREIKDYMAVVESFRSSNAGQIELIKTQLTGDSSNPHATRMISYVSAADSALKSSLNSLSRASAALFRVEHR